MKDATNKPFKVAFLGPAQQSIIVNNQYYDDPVDVARDLAIAMNKELKYLVSMGLEAVQLIDVLPPYTQDMWQIEMQNIMFDGVDAIKFWHVCYGSVDGQRDVFDNHAAEMMPLFKESTADVIHLEFTNEDFDELEAFRDFPTDKVLGVGVVNAKNLQVEPPEQIEDRIRPRARGGARRPAAGLARLRSWLLQPHHRVRQAAQHGPGGRDRCGARSDRTCAARAGRCAARDRAVRSPATAYTSAPAPGRRPAPDARGRGR